MGYGHYLITKIKCKGLISLGVVVAIFGAILLFKNTTSGVISILVGITISGYGKFKLNEFYFEREEPRKIFHMEGRFR